MNKMLMFRCDKMCTFVNNYHSSCRSFYYKSQKAPMEFPNGSYITQFLHQHDVFMSCNTVLLHISTPSVNNKDRRQKLT